jgi:hypothetical protein
MVCLSLFLSTSILRAENIVIEKKAADFSATRYLTQEQQEQIRQSGVLRGVGEAEYAFDVPESGWYELYVQATQWATDLYLDGELLIHTPFDSEVWESPKRQTYKVMNLHLTEGPHTLTFSRPWHPGLPYIAGFYLQRAGDLAGRCRVVPETDRLVFRKGERFPVRLTVGKGENGAAAAVNAMLVQRPDDGVIRLFPAWPAGVAAAFEQLRVPGAVLVSAGHDGRSIVSAALRAERDAEVELANPWPDQPVSLRDAEQTSRLEGGEGNRLRLKLRAGRVYRLEPAESIHPSAVIDL